METAAGNRPEASARQLRRALLLCILLDLALIGARVLLYAPLLAQPSSLTYISEPIALLLGYAGVVLAVTASAKPSRVVALRIGLLFGTLTGALWVVNLSLETFARLPGGILTSAPFLLGAFVLWGVAGGASARQTDSLSFGVLAAIWAALICVLITITFGLALAYTSLPRLEQNIARDPDYLYSRWTDVRAFAIANQFNAAASHLLIAPVVATIVGVVGALLSDGWLRLRGHGTQRVSRGA